VRGPTLRRMFDLAAIVIAVASFAFIFALLYVLERV
jgi:multisubunit Na+/H+ antiporter MnhC subunit